MNNKNIYIAVLALVLGILIVAQIRSFSNINNLFIRDTQSNVFQEIKILKEQNTDLGDEISQLEDTLQQLKDQNLALDAIKNEIEKYEKLTGDHSIFGPGVHLTINANLTAPWIIDLLNVFWNSGAQAVSLNGIRLTNKSVGFDTLPQGQILYNGTILSSPFIFDVIGESSLILDILELPDGIMTRLAKAFPNMRVEKDLKEIIQMQKL